MNKIIAIILLLVLTIPISKGDGCLPVGYNQSLHKWSSSDGFPIIYIEPYDINDPVKTASYKEEVKSALQEWVEASATAFLVEDKDKNNASVKVQWVDNYTKLPSPYDQQRYVGVADKNNVWIVKNDSNGDNIPFGETSNIAMHEFGHVWGINHSNDEKDVMYEVAGVPQFREPTRRDKQALGCSFKGFDVTSDHEIPEENALVLIYHITSKLGDLNNVKTQHYFYTDGTARADSFGGDPRTIKNLKLNKASIENIRTKGIDLSDATEITIGLWILDAELPNIKDAKFLSKKFENTSQIKKEKKKCTECHAWTTPLYDVKGDSLNIYGFLILIVILIIFSILIMRREKNG